MQTKAVYAPVTIRNIAYITDFSRFSEAALPYAVSIARKYESKIFALHVVSAPPTPASSTPEGWQEMAAQGIRVARDSMDRLEDRWNGVPHEIVVRKGDLWAELSEIVEEEKIDLIVAGTHGRTGASKLLLGSVAERIFREAPCPVLTVGPNVTEKPEHIADLRTILCPVDFSAESLAAVPFAISLAQENQARFYLFHVTPEPVNKMVEGKLKSTLLGLIPPEEELWCDAVAFVDAGQAADRILFAANQISADVVILGAKRAPLMPAASTHLPAATAYKVVTQAKCPVLTVR